MALDPATYEAHQHYLNHLMSCPRCYAPTNRYCSVGEPLMLTYHATALLLQSLENRRAFLRRIAAVNPERCEAMKARLTQIHALQKEQEAQALSDA